MESPRGRNRPERDPTARRAENFSGLAEEPERERGLRALLDHFAVAIRESVGALTFYVDRAHDARARGIEHRHDDLRKRVTESGEVFFLAEDGIRDHRAFLGDRCAGEAFR